MASEPSPLPSEASVPDYIPERSPSDSQRTLVMLFDGTGDKEDADVCVSEICLSHRFLKLAQVTNIILLRNSLLGGEGNAHDEGKQVVYYQQGIGTYEPRFREKKFKVPVVSFLSQIFDEAFAWSLPGHVTEAYIWLSNHYQPGDKISLFGFSRGAYTARVLAGMLNAVALLPADKLDKAVEAYKLFDRKLPKAKTRNDPDVNTAWTNLRKDFAAFKKDNNCRSIGIDFIGCWDTVNSVGIIRPIKLKFTANNKIVRVFRHALALDEHRVRFKPNFWDPEHIVETEEDAPNTEGETTKSEGAAELNEKGKPEAKSETRNVAPFFKTDVEEVWFAGCHCDVGGGSVPNDTRPNLAHIPLRWMIREMFKMNTGIIFKSEMLRVIGIYPERLYPEVLPRPPPLPIPEVPEPKLPPPTKPTLLQTITNLIPCVPGPKPKEFGLSPYGYISEEEHDLLDALAPTYDQLQLNTHLWKPLEIYPLVTEVYNADAPFPQPHFVEERIAHKGIGRTIPSGTDAHGGKVKVHRSVKYYRMQATHVAGKEKDENYEPRGLVGYGEKKGFTTVEETEFEWVA
ncbi:hypothetical protein AN958_10122 [Leucoagaricus sp. SymC.cos]|nr:hypothetical protein AN958_10122 [Leucoagaricus sp. SymC.cos]